MRFCQLDRITDLTVGEQIRAVKGLAMNEEYLQDHFPRFPVMPGVLMLEAMYQAGMWLVLTTEDFRYSTTLLKEAAHVKFNDFVRPGKQLEVTVRWKKQEDDVVHLQAEGQIDGKRGVRGRLVIERFNMADRQWGTNVMDDYLRASRKAQFLKLVDPQGAIRRHLLEGEQV